MRNAVLAIGLALATSGRAQTPQPATPVSPKPRLILALSVDQMRYDYLVRFKPLFTGGFKTLLDRGAVFSNARFRHANCETGPGHSVMMSGRNAFRSGIVANNWYDESMGRVVNVVEDPVVSPLGGPGRGASPAHFIGFTIGDMMKKVWPESRVAGISMKDRAAILMAGSRADAAYWYESGPGRFITSSYYMKTTPPWLDALNESRRPDSYASKSWTKLLNDEGLYRTYAGDDHVATEADLKDTTFPHPIHGAPGTSALYESFKRTPFLDEFTLEVSLAAMKAHDLGGDAVPDVLAISLSATDVIGHAFGPDSHEIMDQILRLDQSLERLFDAIQSRVGLANTIVVLSSDHSVMPLVESLQKQGVAAKRVHPGDLQAAGMAALEKRFPGRKDLVASYLAPDFYLNLESIARQGLSRHDVEQTLADALMATGVVAKIYTPRTFINDPPSFKDDPYFDAVRRSYFASRSPHVTVRLKEFMYLTASPGGTGHGSGYEYDRHVPMIFMGSRIKAGVYSDDTGPEDIATTLGLLLGIDYPLQDARRRLTEMIQP